MYKAYKEIAEFRIVYIREAHASDSSWPVPYATDKGITQHKTYGDRCDVAQRLLKDKGLSLPTIIDAMDNKVTKAYDAFPNRAFLVRKDGRLGVAAGRGPRGYRPALRETERWLAQYKETGVEPDILEE
jgi:hypothetical protein